MPLPPWILLESTHVGHDALGEHNAEAQVNCLRLPQVWNSQWLQVAGCSDYFLRLFGFSVREPIFNSSSVQQPSNSDSAALRFRDQRAPCLSAPRLFSPGAHLQQLFGPATHELIFSSSSVQRPASSMLISSSAFQSGSPSSTALRSSNPRALLPQLFGSAIHGSHAYRSSAQQDWIRLDKGRPKGAYKNRPHIGLP